MHFAEVAVVQVGLDVALVVVLRRNVLAEFVVEDQHGEVLRFL